MKGLEEERKLLGDGSLYDTFFYNTIIEAKIHFFIDAKITLLTYNLTLTCTF